ncbi:MAG: DUF937 domain-containing protein [Gammaproteobacteria bacterium]|nr:DUF937 domain-containing protein [Gammaproteobacteria bacterium]
MDLLKTILESQNGGGVEQLANQFGLDKNQANSALAQLIPALAGGVKKNVQQGGLDSLISALNSGSHSQYLDNPSQLGNASTASEGNAILGHLLGSKDVSRRVAGHAAQNTGIDSSILKKMLPIVATMVMGGMSKQSGSGGVLGALLSGGQSRQSSGLESMLTSFLDQDGDGSVVDDLMSKFLK